MYKYRNNMPSLPLSAFSQQLAWQDLDPAHLQHLIDLAFQEDLGGLGLASTHGAFPAETRDVTTRLLSPSNGSAELVARKEMTLCGLQLVPLILQRYGGGVRYWAGAEDGDRVGAGTAIGVLEGDVQVILMAERVMLNFLQRLSGISTLTAAYVNALGSSSTRLLDTRKTTPGYRMLEKYAVACGGGWNHRLGLFDRVMLKDNHLAATGATGGTRLRDAVQAARTAWPELVVEVEVDQILQIAPVIEAGADILLLDNFSNDDLAEAVAFIDGRARTEASGGITIERLPSIGALGLDFVSTGALTHASKWLDIGLDWS